MSSYTLITGATGVLGKAFCYAMAEKGKNLFLTGRSLEKLEALKEQIVQKNRAIDVQIFPCHLEKIEDLQSLFQFGEQFTFEYLINVAGDDTQKPFLEYSHESIAHQFRANVEGAIQLMRFVIEHRAKCCNILNISSVSGIYPMPYFAIYSSAKGALTQCSIALHHELKAQNIHITAVLPGAIYTRADVIDYIKTQGVWGKLLAKSPQYVVEKSLKALSKNKTYQIIGLGNRIVQFFIRLIPNALRMRYIKKRWSKTKKGCVFY